MLTIGVIGANGQVGMEVCLFLSQMKDVRVIPISRSKLGASFLRRCGLSCRYGELKSREAASDLLADCDLVADFSLPKGSPRVIRSAINSVITNAIAGAPPQARFVYISSLMALGMGEKDKEFKNYTVARSVYGSTKRYGERLAFRTGRRSRREVYVLRLGQVHGELQSVSRSFMRSEANSCMYLPAGPSYTVFAFTIAEALVNIAAGKESPGLYTLISMPEWSWKEVQEFYAQQRGEQPELIELTREARARFRKLKGGISSLKNLTLSPIASIVENNRELLAGAILFAFPTFAQRLKAARLRKMASAQISVLKRQNENRFYDVYTGHIPGQRLKSLSDSRQSMEHLTNSVRNLISNIAK